MEAVLTHSVLPIINVVNIMRILRVVLNKLSELPVSKTGQNEFFGIILLKLLILLIVINCEKVTIVNTLV